MYELVDMFTWSCRLGSLQILHLVSEDHELGGVRLKTQVRSSIKIHPYCTQSWAGPSIEYHSRAYLKGGNYNKSALWWLWLESLCTDVYKLSRPTVIIIQCFWNMWAESQKCGQKSCSLNVQWILVYYHYNSCSAHISQILPTYFRKWPPPEKTTHFGAKKIMEWSPKKFCGPGTYPKCIFCKKTDSDWSTLASGRLFIKFRSI